MSSPNYDTVKQQSILQHSFPTSKAERQEIDNWLRAYFATISNTKLMIIPNIKVDGQPFHNWTVQDFCQVVHVKECEREEMLQGYLVGKMLSSPTFDSETAVKQRELLGSFPSEWSSAQDIEDWLKAYQATCSTKKHLGISKGAIGKDGQDFHTWSLHRFRTVLYVATKSDLDDMTQGWLAAKMAQKVALVKAWRDCDLTWEADFRAEEPVW